MAANPGLKNVALVKFFDAAKPTLWLTVKGKKYVLVQYNATFALNEIPTASCTLATGERVTQGPPGFTASEKLAEELSGVGLAPATVTLDLDGSEWEPSGKKFKGKKVIFEGYYAGVAYQRVGAKIQLTVSLVHKLVDLTFGSIFSENMHPSNAASLVVDAVAKPLGGCQGAAAGSTGKAVWGMTGFLGEKLPPGNRRGREPGFGSQLIEVLKCCAKLNLFKINCDPGLGGARNTGNAAATAVLNKIASETGRLSPPLNNIPFTTSISSDIATQLTSFRGITFWDLLVNKWCPDFMLAISPLPGVPDGGPSGDYATIIPNIPTHQENYTDLYLNDYATFEMRASQHKPLMAVGVFAPSLSTTGATWLPEPTKPVSGGICIGGMYPTDAKATGQFLALQAPGWLQNVLVSSGAAGAFVVGGNTASDPEAENGKRDVSYTKHQTVVNDVLKKLAHTYYMANSLRGRSGSFGSKLRFDIAPGTIVKLHAEKAAGSHGDGIKSLPADLYGQVTRVTYNLNADAPVARTDFDIVAVRNEEENKDSDYASSKHPLFDGTWAGGTLVKGWDFK
jgi:hypothetical protein